MTQREIKGFTAVDEYMYRYMALPLTTCSRAAVTQISVFATTDKDQQLDLSLRAYSCVALQLQQISGFATTDKSQQVDVPLRATAEWHEGKCYSEEVRAKIQQAIGPHENLTTIVKRRKL